MRIEQLAINSVSNLPHTLEPILDAYARAGFQNVEFCLQHVWDYLKRDRSPADVKRLLDERCLKCIGGFEGIVACFGPKRARNANHKRVLRNAELLAALGACSMVVGTDGPKKLPRDIDPVLDTIAGTFSELADSIRNTGITICIEFNWSPVVKSLRTAAAIARRARRKNVGILFDPAHYHCTPTKFEHLDAATVRGIRHVHVDDMRDVPGEFADCNADRVLPGKGCLDLISMFRTLEQYGYDGYFSIEMFDEGLWAMEPYKAARKMYASMTRLAARCSTPPRT